MRVSRIPFPGVALLTCVLAPAGMEALARPFANLEAGQAGPTVTGLQTAQVPDRPIPERFMVIENGCALLGPDGEEKERLESISSGTGAISPDGRWLAFDKAEPNPPSNEYQGKLVIQSRIRPDERTIVPLVWGTTGSSIQMLWSSDSRRILICEQGANADGSRGSAYRVYDLTTKGLTRLKLPDEWWPSDWSGDGKRLLTSLRSGGTVRVAWVNADGTGKPEFITSEHEVAYGARLSPDGRRILCMARPKTPDEEGRRTRLQVIDLGTKKQTMIDKPGHTYGYCWSSDGSKVAYTWQMPLRKPGEVVERKTYLITCDADGSNQKTVTMRKYKEPPNSSGRDAVTIFFQVVAWWR